MKKFSKFNEEEKANEGSMTIPENLKSIFLNLRSEVEDAIRAIVAAGKTRLRPVLLTAITTILGLIPLAVGINIDFLSFMGTYTSDFYIGGDNVVFWGPMSWTIIFGLTVSTFLTLVIVPVMYLLTEGLNRRLGLGN